MDQILEKKIRKIIREAIEEMSGSPRLRRMMMGDVESVDSIGILTAENPMAQPISPQENNKRMEQLKSDIRSLGYGFIPIEGKYELKENSFAVPNIKKGELIKLGEKFEQDSVIFGEKIHHDNLTTMKFEFIKRGKVIETVYASISNDEDLANKDNFYSAIKNKRFIIPFFDEKERYSSPQPKYSVPRKSGEDKTQKQAL
jgi:hypothetical protein